MTITKKVFLGIASLLVAAGAFVAVLDATGETTNALTMGSRRDCGYTDVIINCGATTTAELLQKYDSNDDGRGNRDIQTIFSHFGITRSDIAGTQVKKGWLNTNGVISVDGVAVATNARSVYRVDPGKTVTPITIGGKTYYTGPVAGNYGLGADVFVYFRNGVFHAAIQASCGNPIPATPVTPPKPKPVYACQSLTAQKIDRTRFRFTTAATAQNGAQIVSYNYNFGDGTTSTGGQTIEHTFARPGTYTVTVSVNVKVDGKIIPVSGANCKYTIKVEEAPKVPVYKCESLAAKKLSRNSFEFTSAAFAQHAEVVSYNYDFGDGTKQNNAPRVVTHTYNTTVAKTYTVTMTVNVKVNGKIIPVSGPNCKYTVKVEEVPKVPKPVFRCDSLYPKLIEAKDRTYLFTLAYTAEGGAKLNRVVYNFGDNTSETFPESEATSVEHSYAQPGNYTVTATLYFNVIKGGKTVVETDVCKTSISIPVKPEYCPIPGKEHLPKNSPECKEQEKEFCPIPGKENLPKESPECVETPPVVPQTPPELPLTGTGLDAFINGGLGIGSITAAGYYLSASRRNLLNALLKK